MILAACIDEKRYKEGKEYLEGNNDLAVEIMNFMDSIKKSIQLKMKLNFEDFKDDPSAPN